MRIDALMKFTLFGFLLLPVVCMSQDLTWPDPVANHVVPRQSTVVTHGPVLGDLTMDSVRVWLRADREVEFEVLIRPLGPPFSDADVHAGRTIKAKDFTGFVEVGDLRPNTE